MFGASALARLDRDVLAVPGLFGPTPEVTCEELIAAYSQIVARAEERGVAVIGATIMPFKGADYYSAAKERVRQAVYEWIRTSKAFDGIVVFDMALRDPAHPERLQKRYDSGDHLHPNPAGYRRMGEAVDLRLFNE